MLWTGLVWLGIGTGRESSCKLGNERSGSIKYWELPMAAQFVASRVVISSTELVSRLNTSKLVCKVVMVCYSAENV
jgi:hypothetical protein